VRKVKELELIGQKKKKKKKKKKKMFGEEKWTEDKVQ
jgi:hypothetical protein